MDRGFEAWLTRRLSTGDFTISLAEFARTRSIGSLTPAVHAQLLVLTTVAGGPQVFNGLMTDALAAILYRTHGVTYGNAKEMLLNALKQLRKQ